MQASFQHRFWQAMGLEVSEKKENRTKDLVGKIVWMTVVHPGTPKPDAPGSNSPKSPNSGLGALNPKP